MSGPEVSVVIPTHNRRTFLSQTLHSVLWQRAVDFEVIVVDDASTDDTLQAIDAFADARIRVVHHDASVGGAASRNSGAAVAKGQWLAFVDDDDVWAPDKLARQLVTATRLGRGWAYCGAVVINAATEIMRTQVTLPAERTAKALPRYDAIPGGGSNVIVQRATWQRTGPFDTRLPVLTDWELYIRLAKHGLPACVPYPLVARRLHPANLSLDVGRIVREVQMIEALHGTKADWGRLHRWMAHSCLRAGRPNEAAREFARAALTRQTIGVAHDLWSILAGLRHKSATADRRKTSGNAAAESWLQPLRRSAVLGRDGTIPVGDRPKI